MSAHQVEVDADCCAGHGQCVALCSDVFALGDAGHAVVLVSEVPAELEAAVRQVVENCPERAITLR